MMLFWQTQTRSHPSTPGCLPTIQCFPPLSSANAACPRPPVHKKSSGAWLVFCASSAESGYCHSLSEDRYKLHRKV